MPARLRFSAALLLAALLVAAPSTLAAPHTAPSTLPDVVPGPVVASDAPVTRTLEPRWIVELTDPPLALYQPGEYAIQALRSPTGRLDLASSAAQQYVATLETRQALLFNRIQEAFPQAEVQRQYQVVFNGLALAIPGADAATAERLRTLAGVAAVYADQAYAPAMYGSVPLIGADRLWNSPQIGGAANAGAGIKIAIIDTGIKIDNPFFNPEGYSYPEGFPKGDPNFTTPKVIVARAYFRPDAPPLAGAETPEPGMLDSSHGTHVAGTAAGVAGTTATLAGISQTIAGVAPAAYLLNYKTFYANDTIFSGSAFDVELIAAIEDAVKDGADVVNNSYGSRAESQPAASALTRAAEAAVAAGVVMVFAGGNDGPNGSTAGSPGYSEQVISVGAATTDRSIGAGFVDVVAPEAAPATLQARPFGRAGFGPPISAETLIGPAPFLPIAALTGSTLGCEAAPAGSLDATIAVIERGDCPFVQKALNAQQGGALAVIIYNSAEGGEQLIGMAAGAGADQVTIPAVSVARSTGLALLDWQAQQGEAAQLQIDGRVRLFQQTPDVLANFSARGPSFQGSLKPDVVAPGVNILSAGFAVAGNGLDVHRGFGVSSGTSMAAPHVAGAVALLRQLHPDWTPGEIKAALMETATPELWLDQARSEGASVLARGAGRINVEAAANPGLLIDRPALSYGNLRPVPGQPTRAALSLTARNLTDAAQTYTLSSRAGPGVTITTTPTTLQLAAGARAQVVVTIEIPADAGPGDYEGSVELSGGPQPLRLPVWARTLPAEPAAKVLLLDNDGSSSLDLADYSGYYGNILAEQNISFVHLDVDAQAGARQTLPGLAELQRYELVLWFSGDNALPSGSPQGGVVPLTPVDQDLLIAYLQSGGNLIATGQDLTFASDISTSPPDDPRYGRSDLYHWYLGARFVQDDVFSGTETLARRVVGAATQPWLEGLTLDLSTLDAGTQPGAATGAGNQTSIDEIMVVDQDPRSPDLFTTPILRAENGSGGIVGLNRADEPTLEKPALGIPYRSSYLSFGLEGVRDDAGLTTRKELLQRLLYWTVDRPSVTLELPEAAQAGQQQRFSAQAQSNTPTSFVRYRWDFGDGSAIVETTEPVASHSYAQAGEYQARVEATNGWGHRALTSSAIVVSATGALRAPAQFRAHAAL